MCALCERTWAKLSERKNDGEGEGGEGRECKPKNKKAHSDMRKNPQSDESCDDVKKKHQQEE